MAIKFLFRLLKDIDPQAQYDAIKVKDPLTLYFLANGTGYLGETKIFDTNIFSRIDDISSIKSLETDMLSNEFVPDDTSVASTNAIVKYIKKQIEDVVSSIPDDSEALKELADAIENVRNNIPAIPNKLPADGGNADTIGGKAPEDFASAEHKHSEYAINNDVVPKTRTINSKALSEDINLTYSDVDADQSGTAEQKANDALKNAKAYTDEKVGNIKIPEVVIPEKLPADGGNADTVGGKSASDFADASHEHDNYSLKEHKHTEYAAEVHNHDDSYAAKAHNHTDYASKSHEHDDYYATIDHDHDEYSLKNHTHTEYALDTHNHSDYAAKDHKHDYANTVHEHEEYALKNDVSDDIDIINQSIQATNANVNANTDAITILNGKGDGSVDKKITDAFNEFLGDISDDGTVDALKELLDYASSHGSEIETLISEVATNKNNLSDLTDVVNAHKNNKENPHEVTLSQLGVLALASELNLLKGIKSNVQTQLDNKAPQDHTHDITYEDVGADAKGSASAALAEAKAYINELTSQISQVQIVTWEDDD